MAEFKSDIAYDEDVMERALEILKEQGIETDRNQLERVYKYSAKYINKAMREESYCSVNLSPIGTAYYHLWDVNKIKNQKKNQYKYYKDRSEEQIEKAKKEYEVWQKKSEDILQEYEMYRPKENVSKDFMFYHIISNLRRGIKRRRISTAEVEEIQNNIK